MFKKIAKLWEALNVRVLRLYTDNSGATAVEYAIVAAAIAAVVIVAAGALGGKVTDTLQGVADSIIPPVAGP